MFDEFEEFNLKISRKIDFIFKSKVDGVLINIIHWKLLEKQKFFDKLKKAGFLLNLLTLLVLTVILLPTTGKTSGDRYNIII